MTTVETASSLMSSDGCVDTFDLKSDGLGL